MDNDTEQSSSTLSACCCSTHRTEYTEQYGIAKMSITLVTLAKEQPCRLCISSPVVATNKYTTNPTLEVARTQHSIVKLAVGRPVMCWWYAGTTDVIRAILALFSTPHYPARPATSLLSYPYQALLLPLFPIFSPSKVPRSPAHAVHVSLSRHNTSTVCFSQPDKQYFPSEKLRPTHIPTNTPPPPPKSDQYTTATRVQVKFDLVPAHASGFSRLAHATESRNQCSPTPARRTHICTSLFAGRRRSRPVCPGHFTVRL